MKKGTAQHTLVLILILLCGYVTSGVSGANELHRGRSAGCGVSRPGTGDFQRIEVRVLNDVRTYYLRVPGTYDPNRAYPVIFRWHGYSGNGLTGPSIEYSSGNDAIVIGANGINKSWNPYADSVNLLFFDLMLETTAKRYCIDRDRIFSYGFSMGGTFTNLLACARGDVLRASASVAGGPRGEYCRGKVAAWFLHDQDDKSVPIKRGKAARDRALALNGCSTRTVDEGDGCVRYQGCDAAPVVWCESSGIGHDIRNDFAPPRVWKFFQSLR